MKPALYYAIKRNSYHSIVAVTSEHASGKWAGRYVHDNSPTHGVKHEYGRPALLGRFETQEIAASKVAEISRIVSRYEREREPHNKAITTLYRDEREAIEGICK